MDWISILSSESVEEEEMSMLAAEFAARILKRVADLEDEPTPILDGKRPKWSSPNEEVEKDWAIVLVDSPDRATNDQPILKGTPNEDSVPQEEGIPVGGPSIDEIGEGSPLGVVAAPLPSRRRPPDQVLLSTYIPLHGRIPSLTGMVTPGLEGAREIYHH